MVDAEEARAGVEGAERRSMSTRARLAVGVRWSLLLATLVVFGVVLLGDARQSREQRRRAARAEAALDRGDDPRSPTQFGCSPSSSRR